MHINWASPASTLLCMSMYSLSADSIVRLLPSITICFACG